MNLTKHIITNAILLWAFSPVSLANAIRFDDPKFVTLSDGRNVPYGQGVICSDECVEAAAESLPDSRTRRWWLVPITTVAVLCAVLCRPGNPPTITPDEPLTPRPNPTPAPRRDTPPRAEVPDRNSLELVGLGLAMCWCAIRLKKGDA